MVWEGHFEGFFGSWVPLGVLFGATWVPPGGFSGASRGRIGRLLGVLGEDLELNIISEGLDFSGGPSWSSLGVVFEVLGVCFFFCGGVGGGWCFCCFWCGGWVFWRAGVARAERAEKKKPQAKQQSG